MLCHAAPYRAVPMMSRILFVSSSCFYCSSEERPHNVHTLFSTFHDGPRPEYHTRGQACGRRSYLPSRQVLHKLTQSPTQHHHQPMTIRQDRSTSSSSFSSLLLTSVRKLTIARPKRYVRINSTQQRRTTSRTFLPRRVFVQRSRGTSIALRRKLLGTTNSLLTYLQVIATC